MLLTYSETLVFVYRQTFPLPSATRRIFRHFTSPAALFCALTAFAFPAHANDINWAAPVGGVFSVGSNWSGSVAPGSSDDAFFQNGSTGGYAVSFATSPNTDSLNVLDDNVTFDLAGQTYTPGTVALGTSPGGTLKVESSSGTGTLIAPLIYIGGQSNGTTSGDVGTLIFDNGAQLTTTTSGLLYVGYTGTGTLDIQDGAIASTAATDIGYVTSTSGTANVSGLATTWANTGNINIAVTNGKPVSGTLNIENGAFVHVFQSVNVAGDNLGTGTVAIQNGSLLASGMTVGIATGGIGTVTISGSSSNVTLNTFSIAGTSSAGGTGVVTIQGGNVSVAEAITIWNTAGSSFNLSGGSLTADSIHNDPADTGNYASFNWTGGTLTLTHGGTSQSPPVPFDIDGGGLLGPNPTIHSNMSLNLNGNFASLAVGDYLALPGNTSTSNSLTVDGGNLSVNRNLNVGFSFDVPSGKSNAALTIKNGGTASDFQGTLGFGANFNTVTATVDGPGSSWVNNEFLIVGNLSPATLTIQNGAAVSTNQGYMSAGAGNGTVTVQNAGSSFTAVDLYIGGNNSAAQGAGILNIMTGGSVSVTDLLTVWNSTGTRINLAGGTLNVAGLNFVAGTPAALNWTSGTLNFTGAPLTIGAGGPLGSTGTLNSGMTLSDSAASNALTIAAGGSLNLTGGTLRVGSINVAPTTWTSGTIDLTNSSITLGPTSPFGPVLTLNSGMTLRLSGSSQSFSLGTTSALVIQGGTLEASSINLTQSANNFGFISGTIQIDTGTITAGGTANNTFAGNVTGSGSLTKTGSDTIILQAANTYFGGTSVTSGLLIAAHPQALGTGPLAVHTGAIVRLQSGLTSAVKLPTLAFDGSTDNWTGALDLTNNKLIVEAVAATKSTTLSMLQNQTSFGRTHSTGVISSTLPANFAIALLDNAITNFPTFGGLLVDSNSILLSPELLGDANADGHVDLTDLSTILNNFGATTPNWTSGNFDNAPTIDLTDLSDVLNNFGQTNPSANSQLPIANDQLPATPAPEPATLALLLPAALLAPARRTHR